MAATIRRVVVLGAFLALALAQGASASVLWTADAERPLLQEWANFSCQDASRIARVTSPAAQGRNAYRVDLHDGDDSFGERCEMAMGNPTRAGFPVFEQGDESWIAYQVYLPAGFPSDGNKYNEITQFKQVNDLCSPALTLHVEQGQLMLFHSEDNRSSCGGRSVWRAPVVWDRWIKLLYHVEWSSDPERGSVELYGDIDGSGVKLLIPRTAMFTMKMDPAGLTLPVDARLGIYRDRAIAGDATAYFDGFTIATDRASAEEGAFGTGSPAVEPPVEPPAVPSPDAPPVTGPADPSVTQAGAPPRVCRVPLVVHHRLRAADIMLKRAGCETRRARRVRSSRRHSGRVLRQSVPPGTVVPAGTTVRLVVGRHRVP
jgi:hypothetical protein